MDGRFVALVRDLLEAMGQGLEEGRPIPDGMAVRTQDGYLYVVLSRADRVDDRAVERWREAAQDPSARLVVFSLDELPADQAARIAAGGGLVLAGMAFSRLLDNLGIESDLLPAARDPDHRPTPDASLPSAARLDAAMRRARVWEQAGVWPLAARFFSEACTTKAEFAPAWEGLARALTALDRRTEAEAAWARTAELRPGDPKVLLAWAVARGRAGDSQGERHLLERVLVADPGCIAARAEWVTCLLEEGAWMQAVGAIDELLSRVGPDPRLRFLRGVALARAGDSGEGIHDIEWARAHGLSPGEEERLVRTLPPPHEGSARETAATGKAF
ncbi:MAG: hypothetical protein QXG65_06165 [Thermoplasmata archaeon]